MQYVRKYDFTSGRRIIADEVDLELNEIASVLNGAVSTDNLTDACVTAEKFVTSVNPEIRLQETMVDGVYSGLTLTPTSGWANRIATIAPGVAYIRGKRLTTSIQDNRTFLASRDTYIDVDKNGNFTYPDAALGGTEPAVTANSVRIAHVITDATKIVRIYDRRPWQWIKIQPYRVNNECGTFHNSWTYYEANEANWEHIYFMKDQLGFVHFRGLSVGGTFNSTPIMIMPPGFRIKTTGTSGSIYTCSANDAHARVDVRPNGYICPTSGAGWLSMCAIVYKAEA